MSIRRGINRRQRPRADIDFDFNADFDSLEDITDALEELGSGVIEFHPPEFEEPSFGDFLWEDVILLGLFRATAWPEITISDCEICVGIALDVSIYATAQGKGARVCYRFDECKDKEIEDDPPPPPPPLEPGSRLPSRRPPRPSRGGILSWCTSGFSTSRYRTPSGGQAYRTSSVSCGEWIGEAKNQQESFTSISAEGKFENYERITQTPKIYLREQYWVYIEAPDGVDVDIERIWKLAQKDDVFIGCANKRNGSLVFWLASEYHDQDGLRDYTWNSPGLDYSPTNPLKAPPPKNTNEDEDDMSCCKNQRDNDALLKLIYRDLTKVGKEVDKVGIVTGIKDFPVTAPRYLSEESGGVSLSSIPRFQRYIVEQLDALVGQFPIEIEIEDVDPTQGGNQKETVKLPNIAESIAEIYGLLTKTAVDGDVSINFLSRLAFELLSVKAATLLTQSYARGNAAYLGYQGNLKKFDIQNLFNIDADNINNLEDFLKSDRQKLETWVNEDKNTVQAYLERLMYAASVIKQVYVQSEEKGSIEKARSLVSLLTNAALDGEGSKAWDDFMKYVNTEGFVGRKPGTPQPSAKPIDLE